jgi:hypothetical protein
MSKSMFWFLVSCLFVVLCFNHYQAVALARQTVELRKVARTHCGWAPEQMPTYKAEPQGPVQIREY